MLNVTIQYGQQASTIELPAFTAESDKGQVAAELVRKFSNVWAGIKDAANNWTYEFVGEGHLKFIFTPTGGTKA